MTDREFENIIKEKFSAVKCSDVGKKRIFDALKGADDMKEKTGRNVFNEKTGEIQDVKAARVSRKFCGGGCGCGALHWRRCFYAQVGNR